MEKWIGVDLQKRMDGPAVLSSAHGDRRAESPGLAAAVEHLEVSMVDFLCRRSRIVESGPPPVLRQAVKGNMHGRESGNVELRPSLSELLSAPNVAAPDFQCRSDGFKIDLSK